MARPRKIKTPGATAQVIDSASENELPARAHVAQSPDGSDTPSVADQQALTVPASIDPTTISHPVLTDAGWVVPEPKA